MSFLTRPAAFWVSELIRRTAPPFHSRAEALAGKVLPWTNRITVLHPRGLALHYRRNDASLSPALVLADGSKWVPDGDALIEHYGGGTGESTATNAAAWAAATAAHNVLHFLGGTYFFGANSLVIDRPYITLRGGRTGRTYFNFTGTTNVSLDIRPTDPDAPGSALNGPTITDITLVGPNASSTSGRGLRAIMANNMRLERVVVQGFFKGYEILGGQGISITDCTGFARLGSLIADVTGSRVLEVGPFTRAGGAGVSPFYTSRVSNLLVSADTNKNAEDLIFVGGADGLVLDGRYAGFGRRSLMRVEPTADAPYGNVTATSLADFYFDGVTSTGSEGADYGITFGPTAFTGRVNWFTVGSGCFLGNYRESAIYAETGSALRGLFLSGANFSGCADWIINIDGATGSSGTRISIDDGCSIRNGSAGGIRIGNVRSLEVIGATFSDNAGASPFHLFGQIDNLVAIGNNFLSNSHEPEKAVGTTITNQRIGLNNVTGTVLGSRFSSTPTITFGGGSTGITYNSGLTFCNATVVDDVLTFSARVVLTSKGSSTGTMSVNLNLPSALFAVANAPVSLRLSNLADQAAASAVFGDVVGSSAGIRIGEIGHAGSADVLVDYTDANVLDNFYVELSGSYRVAR